MFDSAHNTLHTNCHRTRSRPRECINRNRIDLNFNLLSLFMRLQFVINRPINIVNSLYPIRRKTMFSLFAVEWCNGIRRRCPMIYVVFDFILRVKIYCSSMDRLMKASLADYGVSTMSTMSSNKVDWVQEPIDDDDDTAVDGIECKTISPSTSRCFLMTQILRTDAMDAYYREMGDCGNAIRCHGAPNATTCRTQIDLLDFYGLQMPSLNNWFRPLITVWGFEYTAEMRSASAQLLGRIQIGRRQFFSFLCDNWRCDLRCNNRWIGI